MKQSFDRWFQWAVGYDRADPEVVSCSFAFLQHRAQGFICSRHQNQVLSYRESYALAFTITKATRKSSESGKIELTNSNHNVIRLGKGFCIRSCRVDKGLPVQHEFRFAPYRVCINGCSVVAVWTSQKSVRPTFHGMRESTDTSAILRRVHCMYAEVTVDHSDDVPIIVRKPDGRQETCYLEDLGNGRDGFTVSTLHTCKIMPWDVVHEDIGAISRASEAMDGCNRHSTRRTAHVLSNGIHINEWWVHLQHSLGIENEEPCSGHCA